MAFVVSDGALMVHMVFVLRLPIGVGQCFSIALVKHFFGSDVSLFSMVLVGLL